MSVSSQEPDPHHHKVWFHDSRLVDIHFVDFVGIADHDFLFIANAETSFYYGIPKNLLNIYGQRAGFSEFPTEDLTVFSLFPQNNKNIKYTPLFYISQFKSVYLTTILGTSLEMNMALH